MDLRDTLAQLPPDYPVTLRLGVYEYVSPAAEWLEQDLTQYELVTNIVLPDQPTPPTIDPAVQEELTRLRTRNKAQQLLKAELRPPTELPPILTLKERLLIKHPEQQWRINGWQPANTRALLAAQYKAGKTILTGNLARSLADGVYWLDHSETQPVTKGTVTIIDFEMSERQIDGWLSDQNIVNTDKVVVIPLRGRATTFDILDDKVRAEWADRLANTEYLILDCLRPVLDANGLDEHRDAGQFLVAFDELCQQADIPDALLVHHMGHSGERSRGDSRLRDWPDVEWRLIRADDEPSSPRFVTAFGRDVNIPEGEISYNPDTRHVKFLGGNRATSKAREYVHQLTEIVRKQKDPITKTQLQLVARNELGITQKVARDALEIAIHQQDILVTVGASNSNLLSVGGSPWKESHQLEPVRGFVYRTHGLDEPPAEPDLPDPFDESKDW